MLASSSSSQTRMEPNVWESFVRIGTLVIGQTPLSAQASGPGKEGWKRTVGRCAREKINAMREQCFLDDRPLMATIYYFPPTRMTGDIDNIVKPILDGIEHIAYPCDQRIERVVVQKFEPGVSLPWLFPSPSPVLEAAVKMNKPALYIRLEDDLAWRNAS